MSRLIASLVAIGLLASPAAVFASDVNSAADFGASAYSKAVSIYPHTRAEEREWLLQRLDKLCSSKLRSDQRRCDRAWRIIADGYAQLQARRAAEAASATTDLLKD